MGGNQQNSGVQRAEGRKSRVPFKFLACGSEWRRIAASQCRKVRLGSGRADKEDHTNPLSSPVLK